MKADEAADAHCHQIRRRAQSRSDQFLRWILMDRNGLVRS